MEPIENTPSAPADGPAFALDAHGRAERALGAALALTGPGALFEPDVLKERLLDGEAGSRETELLLAAVDAQVPQTLLAAHGTHDEEDAIDAAKARLVEGHGLALPDAAWAVDAWARCLRLDPQPTRIVLAPDAPLAPPTGATAESSSIDGDRRNSAAELLAVASSLPPASSRRRGASSWIGSFVSLALLAAVVYGADSVVDRARIDSIVTAPAPTAGDASPAATAASTTQVERRPETTPIPAVHIAQPSTPPLIADAASDEPLVADGAKHPLYVALDAPRNDVARITSRFVSGDAALWRPNATIDVARDDDARTRFPAGDVRVRSPRDARAIFEYVAITREGQRSPPFRQELRVAAAEGGSTTSRDTHVLTAQARCTRSCGTVLSSEPIDDGFAFVSRVATTLHLNQPVFHRPGQETRVKTDDGRIRVFRTHLAWARGARVRVVAGRLEVLAPAAAAMPPQSLRPQTVAAADPQT